MRFGGDFNASLNTNRRHPLSGHNFAAILPGDSVAGLVVANGLANFLNLYNTVLIVRLVLTWFPGAPAAIVNPLRCVDLKSYFFMCVYLCFMVSQHNMRSIPEYFPGSNPTSWRNLGSLPDSGIFGFKRLHKYCRRTSSRTTSCFGNISTSRVSF